MTENNKVRQLTDLEVGEVSVVDKAAIKRKFLVVKRDDAEDDMKTKTNKSDDSATAGGSDETTAAVVEKSTAELFDTTAVETAVEPTEVVKNAGGKTVAQIFKGEDRVWMSVDLYGPMMELWPRMAAMAALLSEGDQSSLAKRLEGALEEPAADEVETAEITKAKRMTGGRKKLLLGAIDSLTKLAEGLEDEVKAEEKADAETEKAEDEDAEDTDKDKGKVDTKKADTKKADTPTEPVALVPSPVAEDDVSIAKALLALNSTLGDLKGIVVKNAEKADALEARVEKTETAQPVAKSDNPEVVSETANIEKSTAELFPGFG